VMQERLKRFRALDNVHTVLRVAILELDDGKALTCEGSARLLASVKGGLTVLAFCAVVEQWTMS
jgi:hypothetical protein